MAARILLVAPAMTPALRRAAFEDGESIEAAAAVRAGRLAETLPGSARALVSPTVRCGETARALGLEEVAEEPAFARLDVGRWRGRTLEEVAGGEPEALAAWSGDSGAAPHGGESVRELCARVAGWLDSVGAGLDGRTLAVVEPEVVRAVVLHALGAPEGAFWRIDVPPLSGTEVSGRAGRWNLRLGTALVPPVP
ncbi:histidine phosphatase family protein [Streptomyces sp. J2-1]|uniref:histidine phosphatase family protein n=1 Tax=Streptomyces corallincola TaxID=2851888 RepID=UPI001C3845C3|nr:histidine phosphatase family protein [Streptomyces corallincola]MBV2357945.1 histidine phosphatase family protein [Streptomyces corallincola]